MFKPEYDGDHASTRLSGPEKQAFRMHRAALVRRIQDAMLTLSVQASAGPMGYQIGGTPKHLVEFSDRVGEKVPLPPRAKFRPTAAQVSDMPNALQLLDGLTRPFFKVVMLRALHDFAKENDEPTVWTWKQIGGEFGLSESWAESAYDAAVVQAARRSGLLPAAPADYAVLAVAVWHDRGWLTNLSTAADPRQAVANLKGKSPIRLEQAVTIWTAGQPLARRIVEEVKPEIRNRLSHGAWYKVHPDALVEALIDRARTIGAAWMIEDIAVKGVLAA
jgi:hypothetical protein